MAILIGLTGSFGSGKSAVAAMFAEAGIPVQDADQAARDVVEPGEPALREILQTFGTQLLDAEGKLDRKALAEIVFKDPGARLKLNAIIHPRVRELQMRFIQKNAAAPAIVLEIPLLLESGRLEGFGKIVVVTANERTRFGRLRGRGFSEREIIARLGSQMSQARKIAHADVVIDNSGTLDATRAKVAEFLAGLGLTPPPKEV